MKIITLNTWGGRINKELVEFLSKHRNVDMFCFQEVLKGGNGQTGRGEIKSLYEDIGKILIDHTGYFSEYGDGGYYSEKSKDLDFQYGVACFIKKNFEQNLIGSTRLYDPETKWGDYDGRFAAGASLAVGVSGYALVNVHGLWQGSMKKDSEARLEQSKRIIDLANQTNGKKIICGDFNLEPHTESIKMIENLPAKNLIIEYGITSTRTSRYTKELKFADYMFVSPDVDIFDFKVLSDEVSDHLPLYLEIQ
jgi:endonuclease/exonuclease/phosphatase family metal-dependent hydrolase